MPKASGRGFKFEFFVALGILLGLFFVEYPPIFLIGYWSWGALVHKVLSGVLIALNLLITQYAVRRLGLFQGSAALADERASGPVLQAEA